MTGTFHSATAVIFCWIHLDFTIPHDDSQVVDTGPLKDALLLFEAQTMLLQALEDPVNQSSMFE